MGVVVVMAVAVEVEHPSPVSVPAAADGLNLLAFVWYRNAVPYEGGTPMAITATEARKRLFPLIKQVNDDRAPVEIISNHGRAYLVAADDYESMEETDYLLRSPANATRLMAAADEVRRGRTLITKTMEELQGMADEGQPG
jgi:antitoxin YefM